MSRNLTVGILVGLIVLLAGGIFVVNRSKTSSNLSLPTDTPPTMSLGDLIGGIKDQTCTITDPSTGTTGTVYTGGGMFRGDFTATREGKTILSHMVSDSGKLYVWVDGTGQGFTVSLNAVNDSDSQSKQMVDLNTKIEYSCASWQRDNAKFSLPNDVEFKNFN